MIESLNDSLSPSEEIVKKEEMNTLSSIAITTASLTANASSKYVHLKVFDS